MPFVSKLFINYLIAFYVLWGLLNMLGFHSYEGGMMKVTSFIALFCLFQIKWNALDFIVVFYVIYMFLSGIWGDVRTELYVDGIVGQIMPVSMYFIARGKWFKDNAFLENMRWPLLFSFVCAIYLYFSMPSWYVDFKTQNWTHELSGTNYYEHMRLSGFWPWSYFLGYASLFFIMYELKKNVFSSNCSHYQLVLLIPAFLVLFLAQQRVSIAFCFLYIIFIIIYSKKNNQNTYSILLKWTIFSCFVLAAFVLFVISSFDKDLIDYILERSVNSESNIVSDRFKLFGKFSGTISLMGLGLGHNSHLARDYGPNSITDCDYLRILNEIGVIGFFILITIIIVSLLRGYCNLKSSFYEFSIILFLLVAMIGAAPLEHLPLHPYMYWYCIGRIFK